MEARTRPTPSHIPSREEIRTAARDLVPVLRDRAQSAEDLRRMPDETIADLKAAGIHKIFTPKRYGGFEMDWGAHVDVSRELGRGCGSTGWIASVVLSHTWMLGRFPPEAQESFWPDHPDAIIATAFAGGGVMEEAGDGYVLNGQWKFSSGVDHADCAIVAGRFGDYDASSGKPPAYRMALLLPDEYEIIDTWFAEGLRGTGSKDIGVVDQFVPAHRTVMSGEVSGAQPPGAVLHDSYIYGVEMQQYFNTLLSGPILGTARGAMDDYLSATRGRTGQMFGESIVEQIPVQIRVGESFEEIRIADLIIDDLMSFLHEAGSSGQPITGSDRLRVRRETASAARLCLSAAERLANMMGVSAQTGHDPVQRHFRDTRTMSTHGALQWDNANSPTGCLLFGLKTGDPLTDGDS